MLTDKDVTTLGEDVIAWSGLVPITELSNLLKSKLNHISNDIFTIDKQYNKEFNETNAQDFPDGFFYHYFIEIDLVDEAKELQCKAFIEQLLTYL